MQRKVLILASGEGRRMNSKTPKQFLLLNGLPILMHTIKAFSNFEKIFVVLKKDQKTNWEKLCEKYNFLEEHSIVYGGRTRFESVKKGLENIDDNSLLAIHDGVRPLISKHIINSLMKSVKKGVGVIPVVPVKDSIREIKIEKKENNAQLLNTVSKLYSKIVNRDHLYKVQTPQCFLSADIKNAYNQISNRNMNVQNNFTDDAQVFERNGGVITTIKGEEKNIKITTNEDILIASTLT